LPRFLGVSSENCAHRIAVQWEAEDEVREGVFIPRRDTGSRINSLAGGRIFPGVHHYSTFRVTDSRGRIRVTVLPKGEEKPLVEVDASEAEGMPDTSIFSSLAESSAFFEAGCVGYSSRPGSCRLDGLLLKAERWNVTPLAVHSIRSSYSDEPSVFPAGSVEFDHGLLMRDIPHEWHPEPEISSEGRPERMAGARETR
jgi:hypothetical protein